MMTLLSVLFGCHKVETGLNKRYQEIEHRYLSQTNTVGDKLLLHATYRVGALGGQLVVPYASRILRRCINGNERPLNLHSRYIRYKSPKIRETVSILKHQTDGTYRYSGFKQREDWKLSMAFNPYNITTETIQGDRHITLWYDFTWPEPPEAYDTVIPVGTMKIRLNDGLVHVISDCPTYRVQQTWIES